MIRFHHKGVCLKIVKSMSNGFEFYGKAASHTGYRSECFGYGEDEISVDQGKKFAESLIEEYLDSTWIVGKSDHKEWSNFYTYDNVTRLRIPQWHDGSVLALLEGWDFLIFDKLNHYVSIPESLPLKTWKQVLIPITQKATRHNEEAILVTQMQDIYDKIKKKEKQNVSKQ